MPVVSDRRFEEVVSESPFAGAKIPSPPVADDDGSMPAGLREQLDALVHGRTQGRLVLQELARSRVFVPVVATLESLGEPSGCDGVPSEKDSAMATVMVESHEHGRALLAFSSTAAMSRWRADVRPVPLLAPLAARSAVHEAATALLLDIAGPVPFAVTGTELLLLAAAARVEPGEVVDPILVAAVSRLLPEPLRGSFELVTDGPARPTRLIVTASVDDPERRQIVEALAGDRVVSALIPAGLRVSFHDTP